MILENSAWQQCSGRILVFTYLSNIRVTSTIPFFPQMGQERGEIIASNFVVNELALSSVSGSLISSSPVTAWSI